MNVLTHGQDLDVSSAYINDQHVHIFGLWTDSVAYVVGIVPQADRRLSQRVIKHSLASSVLPTFDHASKST